MSTRVRSYSKINLGLAVGPVRPDGFHGLATVYQTLALHDVVTVEARRAAETRITLEADHPGVPRTATGDAEKNTAYRIVAMALERLGIQAEVSIRIEKRLPVQGGMGAGSANAAAALLGLERDLARQQVPKPGTLLCFQDLLLSQEDRMQIAAEVGSDVPLFLLGGTVLGQGRGELVSHLGEFPRTWCVVAVPAVGVSTAQAFREIDARLAAEAPEPPAADNSLTSLPHVDKLEQLSRALIAVFATVDSGSGPSGIVRTAPPATELPSFPTEHGSSGEHRETQGTANDLAEKSQGSQRASSLAWENALLALVRTGIENDFEEVAFSEHPFLRDIKRALQGSAGSGDGVALYAALSGSGSALFGLYKSRADAEAAQHRVQQAGVQAILTETLPRSEYWAGMFAE